MQRVLPAALIAIAILFASAATDALSAEPSIKVLIVDGQNNHNWKETTPVMKQQLEDAGIFSVDVATAPGRGGDMSQFKPDFAAYDVIVANYTGDSWSDETNKSLVDYMNAGGGLVIVHAADNAFPKWKEWNEMIAVGGWGGRNEKSGPRLYWEDGKIVRDTSPGRGGSHGPQHPFTVDVRVPDHPVTKGLPEKFMHPADELYNSLRGPAVNTTVLATAFSPAEIRGTGKHEPALMAIDFGKGRVFHTILGHAGTQMKSVSYIVTFLRGTEWAATGEVTQEVPEDMPGPDAPTYRYK